MWSLSASREVQYRRNCKSCDSLDAKGVELCETASQASGREPFRVRSVRKLKRPRLEDQRRWAYSYSLLCQCKGILILYTLLFPFTKSTPAVPCISICRPVFRLAHLCNHILMRRTIPLILRRRIKDIKVFRPTRPDLRIISKERATKRMPASSILAMFPHL